jgi:glycosyltransferase involved in cell wall biosynthesis
MPATEVSVIVPVFRNAETLAELSTRVDAALAPRRYELLFVDDASPDGTREEIRRLMATDMRTAGVLLDANVGQNIAVLAGLARARGDLIVVMDSDLQDPPEALPALLDELAHENVDVVFAGRRGKYESLPRLATSRALKRLLWLLTRFKLPPNAGLFLVMRRSVAEHVLASAGRDPYVLVAIAKAAGRVAAVPVERATARGSAYTARMRWRVAKRALATAVRR